MTTHETLAETARRLYSDVYGAETLLQWAQHATDDTMTPAETCFARMVREMDVADFFWSRLDEGGRELAEHLAIMPDEILDPTLRQWRPELFEDEAICRDVTSYVFARQRMWMWRDALDLHPQEARYLHRITPWAQKLLGH